MSTYSDRLQIELIGVGDQANAWGTTTNNNFAQSIEQSIAGVYSKNLSAASSPYTLTIANGPQAQSGNENRQAAIIFSGQGSNFIVQFASGSSAQKTYFLKNSDTTYTITCRLGSSGNTFTIQPDTTAFLATDGTNWFNLETTGGTWTTITSARTAFPGDKLFINTASAPVTVTLPASPTVGDEVRFLDVANSFDNNNLTVDSNSLKIDGSVQNLTVATEGASFALVYSGSTYGWKLMEK
tara:strand:+ start:155 stop:874 length:720 start_codon:yes stop_codon:yes gene_type:complete